MTTDLAHLYDFEGPFATVILETPSAVADAADRLRIEWKNARKDLEDAEIPEAVLERIDAEVTGHHSLGEALALVTASDDVVMVRGLPMAVDEPITRIGPIPHLVPLLAAEQATRPYVAVLIDRQGADVWSHGPDGEERSGEVHGDTEHIHRGHPGGWSQRRFQQRAENTWEQNAEEVARVVVGESRRVGARFIAVAGDTRAEGFMEDHLPTDLHELVREVDTGGRGVDGSHALVEEAVMRLIADDVAREQRDLLQRFAEGREDAERTADGPARTLEALAAARVETLLVPHHDDRKRRSAWFGPEPTQIGLEPDTVKSTGVDDPQEADLVDVAVRAALLTGAEARVVPAPAANAPEGIGALLRF